MLDCCTLNYGSDGKCAVSGRIELDWNESLIHIRRGWKPRTPSIAAQDYLRPAAVKAGVIPVGYRGRFGWHNLRHSLATYFGSDADITLATIQAMMRHTNPTMTARYLHRVNKAHVEEQGKFLAAINVSTPVV